MESFEFLESGPKIRTLDELILYVNQSVKDAMLERIKFDSTRPKLDIIQPLPKDDQVTNSTHIDSTHTEYTKSTDQPDSIKDTKTETSSDSKSEYKSKYNTLLPLILLLDEVDEI